MKALTEAVKAEDEYITKLALDALVQRYASKDEKIVKKYIKYRPTGASGKPQRAIHRLSVLLQYLDGNEKNNSLELIEQELNELKNENLQDMTLEEQIRWEYLTGVSLDYFSLLTMHTAK